MPPRKAIAGFLDEIVRRSLADPERKGCLLVNSAVFRTEKTNARTPGLPGEAPTVLTGEDTFRLGITNVDIRRSRARIVAGTVTVESAAGPASCSMSM